MSTDDVPVDAAVLKQQFWELALERDGLVELLVEKQAKIERQRRELRRLNKTLRALWAGARFQVNAMHSMRHPDVPSTTTEKTK